APPDRGDRGPLGAAAGAVGRPRLLDLVEGGGVRGAVEGRRGGGPELAAAGQGEGRAPAPVRRQAGRVRGRRRPPLARLGAPEVRRRRGAPPPRFSPRPGPGRPRPPPAPPP